MTGSPLWSSERRYEGHGAPIPRALLDLEATSRRKDEVKPTLILGRNAVDLAKPPLAFLGMLFGFY
jgi:hypothetical protein